MEERVCITEERSTVVVTVVAVVAVGAAVVVAAKVSVGVLPVPPLWLVLQVLA